MRQFHFHSICCLVFIMLLQAGCTGAPDDSTVKITRHETNKQVVSGTVSGNASQLLELSDVTTGSKPAYFYNSINKFVFVNYSSEKPNNGHEISATLSDGSRMFSFWKGTETAVADVIVTEDTSFSGTTYSLSVSPQEPVATVNINPVSNLAYWLWKHNIDHPFSDQLDNVFLFLTSKFPEYNLPVQNAVRDNPSPELLHLLDDISITVSDNNSRFTLTRKATAQTVCTGSITTFPACP
jgi:hypothetical protein